jgi:tetratricopeptide (TPR) repeat protein
VLTLRVLYAPGYRATRPPLDVADAVGTQLAALAQTFATLLVPHDGALRVCDDVAVSSPWGLAPLLGLAGAGLVLGLALRGERLAALFGAALLPSLGLVPLSRVWSPHYAYIPLAFCALWGASRAAAPWTRVRAGVGVLWLCALGALALRRDLAFASDASLWPAELARAPSCREAQLYVGELARSAGELGAAERHFRAALTARSDVLSYVDERAARHQLGVVQLAQHRFDEAAVSFRAALAATADDEDARRTRINLASALVGAGDARRALLALGDELARPDALLEGLLVGGRCYRALGLRDELLALLPRIRVARGRVGSGAPR